MGIETLNKAVAAAGFAMAAPDDDQETFVEAPKTPESKALVPVQAQAAPVGIFDREAVAKAANWLRGHVPSFGGRAPA